MLVQCWALRRWPSIEPALVQSFVFPGLFAVLLVTVARFVWSLTEQQQIFNQNIYASMNNDLISYTWVF